MISGVTCSAVAGSFDDAVNLYLKGFEQCSAAKAALSGNDVQKARRAFADYESIKGQAAAIDKSILASPARGMDSNLKYCNRVGSDIELAQGTPVLEQGLAECEKAFSAIKAEQQDVARQHFQQYIQHRDNALAVAPGMTGVFSLKSDIRRCDRLESKIARMGAEQAALAQVLESAREESEVFATQCASARKEISSAALSAQAVQAGDKSIARIENFKKNATDFYAEYTALQPAGDNAVAQNLKNGEQCLTALRASRSEQAKRYASVTAEIKNQLNILSTANNNCTAIAGLSSQGPDQGRHAQAKNQFEAARKSRDNAKRTLAANAIYSANPDGADMRDVNSRLSSLDRCLDAARNQVAGLMPVVAIAVPRPAVVPAVVTPPREKPVSSVAAIKLKGELVITDIVPEFAVIYWADGKRGKEDRMVELFSTGFNKKLYVLGDDGEIQVRNADFATHLVSVVNPLLDISAAVVSVSSRQNRSGRVNIPDNTIAMLRSNQDRIAPSYAVNATSSTVVMLTFADDAKSLEIELDNPAGAKKGFLLIPDMDPLEFELAGGEEKNLNLTRDKRAAGTLTLRGL